MVKREAYMLRKIVGPLNSRSKELWVNLLAVVLNREWDEGFGRIFVCWAAGIGDVVDTECEISHHCLL
jgi:telomere length regulation protein